MTALVPIPLLHANIPHSVSLNFKTKEQKPTRIEITLAADVPVYFAVKPLICFDSWFQQKVMLLSKVVWPILKTNDYDRKVWGLFQRYGWNVPRTDLKPKTKDLHALITVFDVFRIEYADLEIATELSGLRYFMRYWFFTSLFIGVFLLSLWETVFLIIAYQ